MSSTISLNAYVGMGANLGDPPLQLARALDSLGSVPGISVSAVSQLYRSEPLGPSGQPEYCNAVCVLSSTISPPDLLAVLHDIEAKLGRARPTEKWSARTLDLDLLHVDGVVSAAPALRLPHPEIGCRNFVLVPLAEVAPSLVIPGLGSVVELAANIGWRGLSNWTRETARRAPGSQFPP